LTERSYRFFSWLSGYVGHWLLQVTSIIVAGGYFFLLPRRLAHSVRFYRALFPRRSVLFAWWCAWRQYQDFASLYCERRAIERGHPVHFESEGAHHLTEALAAGHGVILVMSHFGRWEIGARLLARREGNLMLFMGGQADGGARAGVDQDLRHAGLDVKTVAAGGGQGFDILRAAQSLRKGGLVSLAADRALAGARALRLSFLGHTVKVVAAPFALALTTGAPLLVVFSVKLGRYHYRVTCDRPVRLAATDPNDRQQAMQQAASSYLQRLHDMISTHPEQWQTFGPFFDDDARP
jgi:lauroyl/myristoyl acyltransferase